MTKHYKTTERLLAKLIVSVLFLASFASCDDLIYDDIDACRMFIRFNYDYNMAKADKFAEQCDKVEVFLFDADGILIKTITDSGDALKKKGYKLEVPIYSGDYTIMAWAGRKDSYDLTDITIGISTKEDLILKLKTTSNLSDNELEPLWSGTPNAFTYKGSSNYIDTINLVKNTNRINFAIAGINEGAIDIDEIELKITATNGSYEYDNAFADTETITYKPFYSGTENYTIEDVKFEDIRFTLNSLRFTTDDNVRLSLINKTTGASLLPMADMDLMEYLLKTKPADMTDQEYLDREDTWNITFFPLYLSSSLSYLSSIIEINGWVVWDQKGEL